jgi:hypothetical protein
MEEQQLIEAISQALRKTDVMRSFLKDNLSVQISTQNEYDYGNNYTVVSVGIYLDGEEICTSSDTIR